MQNPVNLSTPQVIFRLIVTHCYRDHGMPAEVRQLIPGHEVLWSMPTFSFLGVQAYVHLLGKQRNYNHCIVIHAKLISFLGLLL